MNLKLYLILGALAVLGVSLWAWGEHRYHQGEAAVQAQWDHDKALQEAKIVQLQTEAQKQDDAAAVAVNSISQNYEQEKANESARTDKIVHDLRTGRLRLRYVNNCAGGPGVPGSSKPSSGNDAAGDGGLPERNAESLVRLTGRCNDTRDRLTSCQQTVTEYYALCGPK